LGCFKNDASQDLKHGPKTVGGYTSEECQQVCSKYIYSAVAKGGKCTCDNTYSTPSDKYVKTPDAECNTDGVGQGGNNRNAVYTSDPAPIEVVLQGKNGVAGGAYDIQFVTGKAASGSFTDVMIAECAKRGMKPICDHPSYCRNDPRTVYIGQSHHIAHGPHRRHQSHMPRGFSAIVEKFNGACAFTAHHGGNEKTLCQTGGGSGVGQHHRWEHYSPGLKWACARYKPRYVGCYRDDDARDLVHGPKKSGFDSFTCMAKCQEGKYLYAGLQDGGVCRCDNTFSTPSSKYRKAPDAECKTKGMEKVANSEMLSTHRK
jgi:WSC domain.